MSLNSAENVRQVVPFLHVDSMDESLRYYVTGLAFSVQRQWVVDGNVRWCWLTLGGASIMLQTWHESRPRQSNPGQGVSLSFQCEDAVALYHEFRSRGVDASEPFVGNSMWVTTLSDPDGYRLEFHSFTGVPEETKLSDVRR